jgi:hypothetical protein
MSRRAKEGACLTTIVKLAMRLCRYAERRCPRVGPGRKPEIPDWAMAVLIMAAVARRKKTKSAQYRFLQEHRRRLLRLLGAARFPSRSTYYDRYRRAWRLYEVAVRLHGRLAVRYGWADVRCVAVDKSLIPARGPVGHKRRRRRRGVDDEAGWARNEHQGWVWGYGYEVIVSSSRSGVVWPLLASADAGNRSESLTLREKIPLLPRAARYVLADRGYDADDNCEALEWNDDGRRTGRRFLCPTRRSARPPARKPQRNSRRRQLRHDHRMDRKRFLETPLGRRLYARRSVTVEPFNSWFKALFELNDRAWHRGLDNNRTHVLGAILLYQILLRINRACGRRNAQIKWILDAL